MADPRIQIDAYSDGALRVGLSSISRPALLSYISISGASRMPQRELETAMTFVLGRLMEHMGNRYGDNYEPTEVIAAGKDVLREFLMEDAQARAEGGEGVKQTSQGEPIPESHTVKPSDVPKTTKFIH